ncbi:MAG: hypothetical protein ACUVQR_02705 [Thermogutta sp.]
MTFSLNQLVVGVLLVLMATSLSDANVRSCALAQELANPSFELDEDNDGCPDAWEAVGRGTIRQELLRISDPTRGYVARLKCTQFEAGFPDSHAMIAQINRVGVKRGQWYRLRLWARGEDIESGMVSISLVNRKLWRDTGLREAFSPEPEWKLYEFHFQATSDLPPEESRFQIWFQGTGTLYLDDIVLEPVAAFRPQRLPQLPTKGRRNLLPNSSFECGGSGWGTIAMGIRSWAGNVFQRIGEWDHTKAYHGSHCWKLTLSSTTPLISYFDYFDPTATPLRSLVLAHEGWIPLDKGSQYVLSAYVCANKPDTPVVLLVRQETRTTQRAFHVGEQWTRISLPFTAEYSFAYCGVGLDLQQSPATDATIWIDAIQCEQVENVNAGPSNYCVSQEVEVQLSTNRPGNIFSDPERGFDVILRVFNATAESHTLDGKLRVLDYRDQPIWEKAVQLDLPSEKSIEQCFTHILPKRRGFFRVIWESQGTDQQSLRVANVDPVQEHDTAFGMNHAFSWHFLLELSHQAGLRWWRDWSCQWRLVQEREGGPFDFSIPDEQIHRVIQTGGNSLVLLPFPATEWSAIVDLDRVAREAGSNNYLQRQLIIAQRPKNLDDFSRYVRATVEHYHDSVKVIEILNEPLFTTYALPNSCGWDMRDYLELLKVAYEAAKAVDSECLVVGGIAAPPESHWVKRFIEQGGLQWCDVMNLHLYPHRGNPDVYESSFQSCYESMKEKGLIRPIWVTEIGCYADDDPPALPFTVGDEAMNRSLRPSELRAAIDLVKFAAVMGSAGVKKIFYHAGTCGPLNENTAGNIFFEYGGAPRKMYAAQAVLSRLLGADWVYRGKSADHPDVRGFRFHSKGSEIIIVWARRQTSINIPETFIVLDIMGNQISRRPLEVGEEPVYLVRHLSQQ